MEQRIQAVFFQGSALSWLSVLVMVVPVQRIGVIHDTPLSCALLQVKSTCSHWGRKGMKTASQWLRAEFFDKRINGRDQLLCFAAAGLNCHPVKRMMLNNDR